MFRQASLFVTVAVLAPAFALAASGEAPVPRSQPRIEVSRQALIASHAAPAIPRELEATPIVIDAERLRLDNYELYLFGIVPPQLSASNGPQARAALDTLIAGNTVHCQIRDRDRDGHLLATCRTATNQDPALELIKRGLAVTARGVLGDSDVAASYIAAEQVAQTQKIGLWAPVASTPIAAPTSNSVVTPSVAAQAIASAVHVAPAADISKGDAKKDQRAAAALVSGSAAIASAVASENPHSPAGFFTRYQIFLTGLVMLLTALSVVFVLVFQRRSERREELRALAAALRGELLAARAMCLGRLKTIMTEADDRTMVWPRIRSTLYQGYVGRIGLLGAELARQIASLYGQSNDYAAYYHPADASRVGNMPKRHALQTMIGHIEEILPKLALIEQTGKRLPVKHDRQAVSMAVTARPAPLHLDSRPLPLASLAGPDTARSSSPSASSQSASQSASQPASPPATERYNTQATSPSSQAVYGGSSLRHDEPRSRQEPSSKPVAERASAQEPAVKETSSAKSDSVTTTATVSVTSTTTTTDPASSPIWEAVRKFTRGQMGEKPADPKEDELPDYTALIEEDMSNFTFMDSDHDYGDTETGDSLARFGGKGRH